MLQRCALHVSARGRADADTTLNRTVDAEQLWRCARRSRVGAA
jgi:hypothetical protein